MERVLNARPLTPESFAAYGAVLMAHKEAPERYEYAGNVDSLRLDAKPNLTFIHAAPRQAVIKGVERHRYSHQLFVPMKVSRYVVGVCPPAGDNKPDFAALEIFIANAGQSVNYNAGIWHSPLLVLDSPAEFVMLRWDDGGAEDTEYIAADQPIRILVD